MLKDSNCKIIWISDLHLYKEYSKIRDKQKLTAFIDRFIQVSAEKHNSDDPVDYILITGDLVQQGTFEDYQFFHEVLLSKLLDRFLHEFECNNIPLPKVIMIPGNHDVNWSNSRFLLKYVTKINPKLKMFQDRSKFLEKNIKEFTKLFADYSMYFNDLRSENANNKYRKFFNYDPEGFELDTGYSKHGLFGYVVDKKRNLIIVLLNSAWYSLGNNFNNLLASYQIFTKVETNDNFSKWKQKNRKEFEISKNYFTGKSITMPSYGGKINHDEVPKEIRDAFEEMDNILSKKDAISEYSNQLPGVNIMQLNEWARIFEDYNDFTVITAMHHPMNWLNWHERYTYEEKEDNNANLLKKLINFSDLFLTGHEHIPYFTNSEIIPDNTLHLKAGCFLADNQHYQINLENSWFSMLSIDTHRSFIKQQKIRFDAESGSWVELKESKQKLIKRSDKYRLSTHREEEVRRTISNIDKNKLGAYLSKRKLLDFEKSRNIKLLTKKEYFDIFVYEDEDRQNLYLVAKKENFYRQINDARCFTIIDYYLSKSIKKWKKVSFIVPDIYVNNRELENYRLGKELRGEILNRIIKRSDVEFDNMRHFYFIRFESRGKKAPRSLPNLLYLKNLSFVNHVIPYFDTPFLL
jgi:predicted phosphodiesterase